MRDRRRIQKETRRSGQNPGDEQDSNRVVQAQPLRERRYVRSSKSHADVLL